jgi:hypothetical protein
MKQCASFAMVALSLVVVALASPGWADGAIVRLMSEEDTRVLAEFDDRRAAAITLARGLPDAAAVATLEQVLAGRVLSFDDGYDPSGAWQCRYLKLGGDPVLSVYGWFSCRVFDDGAGWVIEKTTGSQRSRGRLYRLTEDRLLYLGALHYAAEAPMWFGDDPARNHMAVLTRLDDGRMRLEFPAPLAESDFDILEFMP